MKLKAKFDLVTVGEEIMAVPVADYADELHGVIRLNSYGAEIFEKLREEITEEEIIEQLSAEYQNDREELADFVRQFIRECSENGLLSGET